MDTLVRTEWSPAEGILRTRLSGVLTPEQVQRWREEIDRAGESIPAGREFGMLVDIRGYEVSEQDPAVHRVQREIVPTFLARHGFEVGFFRLFEVENTIARDPTRARCVAVAHVHHDRAKMELYTEKLGTEREGFFPGPGEAEAWLREAMRRGGGAG